jgi:lysophospholipase L1-like esterase
MRYRIITWVILWLAACTPATDPPSHVAEARWVEAWTSPPSPFLPGGRDAYLEPYADITVRQLLRIDAEGAEVRVRFTNELGREPLRIGAASLARVSGEGRSTEAIAMLTFAGEPGVVIPPGAAMLSDPLRLSAARFDELAISTWFPEPTRPTGHRHRVHLSDAGDHTRVADWPPGDTVRGATAVSGVQVCCARARVLVAFGDSITEGAGATGPHMSWPAQLSRLLAEREALADWVVVNAGISGNRLLHDGGSQNGLARFERDALAVAGVTDVIVLEGVNDLGVAHAPQRARDVVDADDLVLAYRQVIERAHLRGVRVYGATILPYEGAVYFSPAGEVERQKVNAWIRESGAFDGVIDLDAVMRDPERPAGLREDYEIGDRLHPNDAGYAAMARAVEAFLAERFASP